MWLSLGSNCDWVRFRKFLFQVKILGFVVTMVMFSTFSGQICASTMKHTYYWNTLLWSVHGHEENIKILTFMSVCDFLQTGRAGRLREGAVKTITPLSNLDYFKVKWNVRLAARP